MDRKSYKLPSGPSPEFLTCASCTAPASSVNHWGPGILFESMSSAHCKDHEPNPEPKYYQYDINMPLIRPGDCEVVDDMIARFCAEICYR